MTAGRLKVLLVDDDPVSCRLAGVLLERMGCARPDIADNGREAADAMLTRPYDLVLIEAEMPELDGIEALRTSVEQLGAQCPRIVFMTAADDGREVCLAGGAEDFVSKPLTRHALAAVLARVAGPNDFNPAVWGELKRVFKTAGIVEMVDAVTADLPEQQRSHAAAAQAGDMAALRRIVHGLRGASLQFGAEALVELCEEAEAACIANDHEPALRVSANALARYIALVERLGRETQAYRI